MPEHVLCDQEIRVTIDGGGERTLLVVTDGSTIRFWADTDRMEGALGGEPVQLSAYGGYCRIEVEGEEVTLEYALEGVRRRSCRMRRALSPPRSSPSEVSPAPPASVHPSSEIPTAPSPVLRA